MGRSPRHFSSPSLAAARREGMEKLFTATWAFPEDFKWDVKEVWAILYLTGRALTAHFHCWTHHRWNMMKYYAHFGKSVITLARTEQIIISFHIWRSNICQARQTKPNTDNLILDGLHYIILGNPNYCENRFFFWMWMWKFMHGSGQIQTDMMTPLILHVTFCISCIHKMDIEIYVII